MEGEKHPFLYLTHCAAPLAHRRCANEYFNESKWILLLSQRCWHPLRSYRWSISARHAPVAWVMYQDFTALGHFKFFCFIIDLAQRRPPELRWLHSDHGDLIEATSLVVIWRLRIRF